MIKTLNHKRPARPSFPLKKSAGFTLIETLVSILIFSVALTAIFSLLSNNLKEASLVKNNFIASGLAQEGIETVRNIRDNDWYLGNPFGTTIPDGTYRVQWNSQALLSLAPEPYLKKDSGSGLLSYDAVNDTLFKRTVTINTISGVEKRVVVSVTWSERGISKSVSAEDHLYDWR
jgi:prepilin-type N-terminal cleavage/methylation domain-containing protein